MRPRRSAHLDRKYRLDSVQGFDDLARHLYPRWRRGRVPRTCVPPLAGTAYRERCEVALSPVTDRRPMSIPRRRGEQASFNKAGLRRGRLRIFSINTKKMQAHKAFLNPDPGLVRLRPARGRKFFPGAQPKLLDIHTPLSCIIIIIPVLRKKKIRARGRRRPRAKRILPGVSRGDQGTEDAGDVTGAIASMISDLRKSEDPLYDATALRELLVEALVHRTTPDEVRSWINSFN